MSCSLDAGAQGPGLGLYGKTPAASCSLDAGLPGLGLGLDDRPAAACALRGAQADGPAFGAHARTASAPDLDVWDMGAWGAPPAADPGSPSKGFGGSGAVSAPAGVPLSMFVSEASGVDTRVNHGTGRVCDPESGPESYSALTTQESWGSFEVPEAEHGGGASGSGSLDRGLNTGLGSRSRLWSGPGAPASRLGPERCAAGGPAAQ